MSRELRGPGSRPAGQRVTEPGQGSASAAQARNRAAVLGLSRDPTAPHTARAWLATLFGAELGDGTLATAKLLVSEIVTNAVLHGKGEIVLRARLDQGRLFAEVTDEGPGFTWRVPETDLDRTAGWGLVLVDGQADRWGVDGATTHVWFELNA